MIIAYDILSSMRKININNGHKTVDEHIADISNEFRAGLEFIKKYPKSVTFFGSSRLTPDSTHYVEAENLAKKISNELSYSIVTGGGAGIMEAASRGANEVGGKSVGINIILPNKQPTNKYVMDSIDLHYFFVRKTILTFAAEAYIFFPGGYGTMDELFEILTLVQTKKIEPVPIILFGKDFWGPLEKLMTDNMLNHHHTIREEDLKLYTITDNPDEVINIIKNAPVEIY